MRLLIVLITILFSFVITGCMMQTGDEPIKVQVENPDDLNNDNSDAVGDDGIPKRTAMKGQLFYNEAEIYESREEDHFKGFEYKLYNFKIYALGRNAAYVAYASYDGSFHIAGIQPDVYKIIIKTKQYFNDEDGVYTYMYSTTMDVYEGETGMIPIIHPVKTYVDSQEGSEAIDEIGEAAEVTGIKKKYDNNYDN